MATPAEGKKFAKKVGNRTVSYGDSNGTIKPGTSKGDAYCARSNNIKGDRRSDPNSPNNLSRAKWKCRGNVSMRKSKMK